MLLPLLESLGLDEASVTLGDGAAAVAVAVAAAAVVNDDEGAGTGCCPASCVRGARSSRP